MDEANVFIDRHHPARPTTADRRRRTSSGPMRNCLALGVGASAASSSSPWSAARLYVLLRYTRELRAARDEVDALNNALEQRVTERTADLSNARDRARSAAVGGQPPRRQQPGAGLVAGEPAGEGDRLTPSARKSALAETQDRIFAISLVHKRLYGSNDVRVGDARRVSDAACSTTCKTSMRGEGQGGVADLRSRRR